MKVFLFTLFLSFTSITVFSNNTPQEKEPIIENMEEYCTVDNLGCTYILKGHRGTFTGSAKTCKEAKAIAWTLFYLSYF